MKKDILFGVCADVHHYIHRDERWRVEKFVAEATERGADFIIQLGDFTSYSDQGREVAAVFNSFAGPCYHVLGNHETKHSDKETVMQMLGQTKKYYSFDAGDYHFVVLDTNYEQVGDEYLDYNCRCGSFGNCFIPSFIEENISFHVPTGLSKLTKLLYKSNPTITNKHKTTKLFF